MPQKILVVEDEEEMRLLIADILKQNGYEVAVPVDSYVALELAQNTAYDLVTLDECMPLLDGEAFARALKESDTHIPILLLCDILNDLPPTHLQELGIRAFIHKPFQVDQLLECIKKILPASPP